jgi:guanine nucleotide-binding protein G(i) subunit alpha
VDGSTINVIDVGQQSSQRGKWIHQFSKVTAILFVVDISCYNNWISEHNEMMDRIVLFDSVINSRWFPENTIVLFLSNISEFRRKLARSPLKDHFRDFDGGNDPDQAAEYLLGRFKQVDRSQRNRLYTHLVDPYDASNIRLVAAAINEDLRRKSQAL